MSSLTQLLTLTSTQKVHTKKLTYLCHDHGFPTNQKSDELIDSQLLTLTRTQVSSLTLNS